MRRSDWLVAIALLCLLAPSLTEASFIVSPMEVHLEIAAGQRGATPITITNTGKLPITLKLYLSDSRFQPSGKEENLSPGTVLRSCAPWVMLEERVLDLEARDTRRIPIVLEIPGDAAGSFWTKLYIEEISTPVASTANIDNKSYEVFMKQRMGVRIFENVRGTLQAEAQVTYVATRADSTPSTPLVLVSVDNPGNSILRCDGRVEIRNSHGVAVDTLWLGVKGKFTLFPAMPRSLEIALTAPLPPDTYTALAIVDFGGDYLVAGDAVFRVDGPRFNTGETSYPGVADD